MKALDELRWRLAASRRLWRGDADPQMTFLPIPPPDRVARGKLDGPGPGSTVHRGFFAVSGWALFPDAATARVEIWLGEELLGRARLGAARSEIPELYDYATAPICGFHFIGDTTDWGGEDGEAELRATAISTAGERYQLPPVPLTVEPPKQPRPLPLPPPAARTPRAKQGEGRQLLVCTHQLNLGGAQLYLLDLLRELVGGGGFAPTVVGAVDGETRGDLEGLGMPVHVTSPVPADDLSAHIGRVEELTHWAADREFELALINTATSGATPGGEVAAELGIPAVWAVHESFPPAVIWQDHEPRVRDRVAAALAAASAVIFEADATRRLYEPPLDSSQAITLPYGLDLAPIERERASFDREAGRRQAGLPAEADVLLCVGTIEARKAQLSLAQAFEPIADRNPDAHLVFVGGSKKPESVALGDYIDASRHRDRMRLIPITPDVHAWYSLSDLLICASDVESLPRTVVEAMALETPVLATDVFGLPELIEDGKTGWLYEAGDIHAASAAMERFLRIPREERRAVAVAARELVERRHSLPTYGRQVATVLEEAASGARPGREWKPRVR